MPGSIHLCCLGLDPRLVDEIRRLASGLPVLQAIHERPVGDGLAAVAIHDCRQRIARPRAMPDAAHLAVLSPTRTRVSEVFQLGYDDHLSYPLVAPELARRLEDAARRIVPAKRHDHSDDPLVERTCHFLTARIGEPIGLDDLARAMGTNRTTLSARFKRTLGVGPLGWQRGQRMAIAKALIADGRLSVLQVAAEVGYPNPNNFSTAFKRAHGASPRAFRDACAAQRFC